ncbi:MAG: MFS transporter [Bacteroidales bacterium]|nr:MFS transporter [Bacteroidales bacterium]
MDKKTTFTGSAAVFLVFLCMGFGDAVGPFVGLARDTFDLSNTMAQLIPFTGFIMFGLLSVPVGVLQDKTGKKFILMLGLIVALVGLVIPLFGGLNRYSLFLLTVLLLGAGATILQVAGNPVMRDVSPEGKYARNLSLGQFVKAIGSLSGPLLPVAAARWWGMGWEVVFPVYSAALLLTIIILSWARIREKKGRKEHHASLMSCLSLLRSPFVRMMVAGIFLYVGAEVCMSSGIPLFLDARFGIDIRSLGVAGTGLFFLCIMTGRFLGSVVLNWMPAGRFLVLTSSLSILGILGLFSGNQAISVLGIIICGLGFANVFPLIFSITVDRMPERSNELSGLMVTAIVGGALLPPLMGVISDMTSVVAGFLVPLAAILYVLLTALRNQGVRNPAV